MEEGVYGMSLIDEFMTSCVMMDKRSVHDGLGGFSYEWTDGAHFTAAIVKDSSLQARIAEKDGLTELYTVTVYKGASLQFHDVFRRVSDGAVFRVTSNTVDSWTPDSAPLQIGRVFAERWELPS